MLTSYLNHVLCFIIIFLYLKILYNIDTFVLILYFKASYLNPKAISLTTDCFFGIMQS